MNGITALRKQEKEKKNIWRRQLGGSTKFFLQQITMEKDFGNGFLKSAGLKKK